MTNKLASLTRTEATELADEFPASIDPQVTLFSLVDRVRKIFNTARCSVVRLDPTVEPIAGYIVTAAEDPSLEGYRLSLDDYPEILAAITERAPILMRDVEDDPIARQIRARHRSMPFPCSLVVPITAGEESFGVLFLRFRDRDVELRRSDVALLQALAYSAAVSLTQAREHEQMLADLREREHRAHQLEEMHHLRMEMMASVSHDLRAPLHAILGYTELLLDGTYGDLSEEQRTVVESIASNSESLSQLVGTVLDYAWLEDGSVAVRVTEGEVNALLEELQVSMGPLARRRGLRFGIETSGNVPKLTTDWSILRRILLNLLHNGIKFTSEGSVTLGVSPGENGKVVFRVRDTGAGIPESELDHVFDRFYRLNASPKEGIGGLGLAIVKRHTELLGGKVSVESTEGVGSEFSVVLPVESAHVAAEPNL